MRLWNFSRKLVFLSYASQEDPLAKTLRNYIKQVSKCTWDVFLSSDNIGPSANWFNEIMTAINRCRIFLVLCSPFSIARQWVNFESGVACHKKCRIIPICHSGLNPNNLPQYLIKPQALQLSDSDFMRKFLGEFSKSALEEKVYEKFRKDIIKALEDIRPPQEKVTDPQTEQYLPVTLNKNGDVITLKLSHESVSVTKPMDETNWLATVAEMHNFLIKPSIKEVNNVGVAIGVQNCLFDGSSIYVGVRMKGEEDRSATCSCLARGLFNTGYKLLRKPDGQKWISSTENLHDLFVMQTPKKNVEPCSEVYRIMAGRLQAAGHGLWRVQLQKGTPMTATIFINASKWYPRFEIGLWKYAEIKANAANCMNTGFGEDKHRDFVGQEGSNCGKINYWIWVKDGEIYYWSFPEERLIPRCYPTPQENLESPRNAVLVSSQRMVNVYGLRRIYTPFAADELLQPDAVIEDQFASPARALLSCF